VARFTGEAGYIRHDSLSVNSSRQDGHLEQFGDVPPSPVSDSGEKRAFEDPGGVVVDHGFACTESNASMRACGTAATVRICRPPST
jgi:hypothetical protein